MSEPDLFDEFLSPSEILGYVLFSHGIEALQQVLDGLLEDTDIDADTLYEAANDLAAADMQDGAEACAIAAEKIANGPSRQLATILQVQDPIIKKARLASLYRNGECTLEDLITADVEADDIEYIARSQFVRARRKAH